jgi:hypothetical protein
VLDLTTDSMTPDYEDNWAALNAIVSLYDDYDALTIVAGKSDANRPDDSPKKVATGTAITIETSPKNQQGDDALMLYLQPRHPNIDAVIQHTMTAAGRDVQSIDYVESVTCDGDQARSTSYLDAVSPPGPDVTKPALVIAQRNILHLWIRLLRLYEDTQVAGGGLIELKKDKSKEDKKESESEKSLRVFVANHPELAEPYKKADIDKFYEALDGIVGSLSDGQLDEAFRVLPRRLELRTAAVTDKKKAGGANAGAANKADAEAGSKTPPPKNVAPVVTTHSALGTLKYAVGTDAPGVEFVTPAAYAKIAAHSWNKGGSEFYTLLYDELGSTCGPDSATICYRQKPPETQTTRCVSDWIKSTDSDDSNKPASAARAARAGHSDGKFGIFSPREGTDFRSLKAELELANLRRYVLIIVDREVPPDAYVAYRQYGYSYYIAGGDLISRKNLSLLSQIMTMQAIPSASPALTPTINVGAQ